MSMTLTCRSNSPFEDKPVIMQVTTKVIKNIDATPIIQQTAFRARVKEKQGIESKAFDIKIKASRLLTTSPPQQYIVDDILILFQNIGDGYTIGHSPYGQAMKPAEENSGEPAGCFNIMLPHIRPHPRD
jgi:hypothetical protein